VGLDDLLERMRRETEQQVAALLSEARAAADQSAQEAEVAITWERSKRLAERENQLRTETELGLEKVRREARQETYRVRREVADRVMERAKALAPELAERPSYLETVLTAVDEAILVLGGQPGRLTVSRWLADRLRDRIPDGIEVLVDENETGFRLRDIDGRVEVHQTVEERLRRMTPAFRIAAAAAIERET
jgi:vacuolar-type H+-ATPase subunit E/Vma4